METLKAFTQKEIRFSPKSRITCVEKFLVTTTPWLTRPFHHVRNDLSVGGGVIFFKFRLVPPSLLYGKFLNNLNLGHPGIERFKRLGTVIVATDVQKGRTCPFLSSMCTPYSEKSFSKFPSRGSFPKAETLESNGRLKSQTVLQWALPRGTSWQLLFLSRNHGDDQYLSSRSIFSFLQHVLARWGLSLTALLPDNGNYVVHIQGNRRLPRISGHTLQVNPLLRGHLTRYTNEGIWHLQRKYTPSK